MDWFPYDRDLRHEKAKLLSHEFGLDGRCIAKDLSVIRQESESQNSCYKKTKHARFPEK